MTGDELYTYLQRSSFIKDRFLLVEELPQFFECFNRSYEFEANESISSVILPDSKLNFAEFNALPLQEAVKNATKDTDGCFVCFGGNTFLIGKTKYGFFSFDSHSRTSEGMLSSLGKSTRLLFQNVDQVYMHLINLAVSMGYSKNVECNLTGVHCKMTLIVQAENKADEVQNCLPDVNELEMSCLNDDSVIYVSNNYEQFDFLPLNNEEKINICLKLNVPCLSNSQNELVHCVRQDLADPSSRKEILADGNCFFRAISFSLTNTEEFHNVMRNAVCMHLLNNRKLFSQVLRDSAQSVESHISSTCMSQEGTWSTEVEILAMAHMLNVDIYTYTGGRWLKYSSSTFKQDRHRKTGSIYLDHVNQNHYNVVLDVAETSCMTIGTGMKHLEINLEDKKSRKHSAKLPKKCVNIKTRRESERKKYQKNHKFRQQKLNYANTRYKEDEEFRTTVKLVNKKRYHEDIEYHAKTRLRRRETYADEEVRKREQKVRIEKYAIDEKHRKRVLDKSKQSYETDEVYRENVKLRSIQRYKCDARHRQDVRFRSKTKYATNENHKCLVNNARKERYRRNKTFKQKILKDAANKYLKDESVRSKVKALSKKRYESSSEIKTLKKEAVKDQRQEKRMKLENEDEIVRVFKEKAMHGIDFTCCCCHRILFQNQVQIVRKVCIPRAKWQLT